MSSTLILPTVIPGVGSAIEATLGSSLSGVPDSLATGEQPGTRLLVRNTGEIVINAKFKISSAAFASIVSNLSGSAHPRYTFAKMSREFVCTEIPGSQVEIDAEYSGTESSYQWQPFSATPDGPVSFEHGIATAEEPIYSNPYFKDLSVLDMLEVKRLVDEGDGLSYPAAYLDWPDTKKKLYDLIVIGKDKWKAPRDTWTATYNSTRQVSKLMRDKRGKVCPPLGLIEKLNDQRDWILDGITQRQTGASYEIQLVWLASGPGGWDKDLYDPP